MSTHPHGTGARPGSEQRDSRVLVFSQRALHTPTWHAPQYEFEDLLVGLDDVDLLAPTGQRRGETSRISRRVVNGTLRRARLPRRTPGWRWPSVRHTRVVADHDLFFAVFHHPYQVSYLHRLHGWRDRCRAAVALLVEVWSPDLEANADHLKVLRRFDVVYVANPAVIPGLVALGVPARLMPMAVDALAFCPLPHRPARVIDCYSYGRSSQETHRALLRLVEEEGLTYLYDNAGGDTLANRLEHRSLLANMMKRSEFFLAYRINDTPGRLARTGGDECLSTRYFEGAGGGAVLLGSRPRSEDFDLCFGWEDAVIDIPYDCLDIGDVLADLRSRPERLAAARANNVRHSMTEHDWVYRWQRVLVESGLSPSEAMVERQHRLGAIAAQVRPDSFLGTREQGRVRRVAPSTGP